MAIFFSVNISMLKSSNGRKILERIPRERVLTESDFPHVRIDGAAVTPLEIGKLIISLAEIWKMQVEEAIILLDQNFRKAGARDAILLN